MIISPRVNADHNLRVSDLLVQNSVCWDYEKLNQYFLPVECDRISSIPLSSQLPNDRICWDLEKNGEYSVRSAYRAMFEDDWKNGEEVHSIWKRVWHLQVLPRIKIFAWRACQNALPTRYNIHHRIRDYDPDCCICQRDFESTLHALRDCKFAREIWSKSQFSHVACSRMSTIIDWWESVFTEFDNDEVASIITLCWAIWGARNSRIMEGKIIEPEDTVKYALKICQEVSEESCKLDVRPGRTAAVSHPETWSVPDQGWHKVNVDAGIIGELGSGLGAVIRDSSGVVCACSSFQAPDKWTTEVAEAKAVLFGLQLAGELGVQQIVLESDCLLVIQALRNKSTGSSSLHLVLDDIYAKSSNFVNVRCSFVKRGGNKIAHALALSQPWEVGHRVWNDVIPARILELASADLNE